MRMSSFRYIARASASDWPKISAQGQNVHMYIPYQLQDDAQTLTSAFRPNRENIAPLLSPTSFQLRCAHCSTALCVFSSRPAGFTYCTHLPSRLSFTLTLRSLVLLTPGNTEQTTVDHANHVEVACIQSGMRLASPYPKHVSPEQESIVKANPTEGSSHLKMHYMQD